MASADGDDQCIPMKKRKMSKEENPENPDSSKKRNSFFKDFKLIKVLREDDRHKIINVHGTLSSGKTDKSLTKISGEEEDSISDAVMVLEKKPFDPVSIEEFIKQTNGRQTLHNDLYSTFDLVSNQSLSG